MSQQKHSENITNPSQHGLQKLLIKVGIVYAVVSIALFFLFSSLMQNHAYQDMSKDEVRHISEMVFESMFTAMLGGQGTEGIEAAAQRMRDTGPGMTISVVRGDIVAANFGDDRVDALRRANDLEIIEVFKTAEEELIQKDNRLRYLYPAIFRQQCQQCHVNSLPGQVAAVVEIIYPISNLKVSTDYVEQLMMIYFAISFVVLMAFLGWRYRSA
jgi:hypothetical protein